MGIGKSDPPPVDYTAAAQAQGAANKDTAIAQGNINNPNMVTPYGASTYSGPTDGSGRGTITQTLSPEEQAKLTKAQGIQNSSLDILQGDLPNIASALSKPFGLSGAPVSGYDPNFALGTTKTDAGLGAAGPIQSSLNYSGAPGLVGTDSATRTGAANAQYALGAQYLDPQFQQEQSDLTTKLANQGITPGSDAYAREMLNFNNSKQKAYSDLTNNSVLTGNSALAQEQAAALANRGEAVGETTTKGQFANTAQAQGIQQLLSALTANNAGVAQQAGIAGQSSQLQNQARQQQYTEAAQNQSMPINLLNALLSGSQVNNPTFNPINPTGITPAPIMQGAISQGQANAAGASANAGITGSALGAAGTAAAAFFL